MLNAKLWRHFDFLLLGAIVLLCIVGVVMIRSATLTSIDTDLQASAGRQIIFGLAGLAVVVLFTVIDYRVWASLATPIYLVLLGLLVVVLIIGAATFGAVRWIDLGPINLQPSELGKFLVILTLGNFIARREARVRQFSLVVQTLIFMSGPVLLLLSQPDFSSCILYGVIWLTLMWAAGMRWEHLALLGALGLVAGVVGFFIMLNNDSLRYIAERVLVFFLPNSDTTFRDATYNVNQSLISVGSGGWFGQGYGQGSQVQLRFLKVRQTDFIFATIAHEFGFVGALVVIVLFALVVIRIYRVGEQARDFYGRLICFGVGTVIMFEAFSNIGSNLNLLPVTGSPLPFISYGGSSLLTFLIGIGLVESVALRHKQIEF
ncbi:MAG: rod shape-determining protein RodA [Anaerolineales bacterium]|nr:rod shape-determining protein RodA [Anaerolineales bacterium]